MIGIDLEDIARWREPRRLGNLFTPVELERAARSADPAPHYAGWWCAREATLKALADILPDLSIRDISVVHDDVGRPQIALAGRPEWTPKLRLSITHSELSAAAVVLVLEANPQPD